MLPRQIAHEMVVAASVGKYLWGLPGVGLEPAPPAVITAATENQQYDEYD
jgi:hypothetical protein